MVTDKKNSHDRVGKLRRIEEKEGIMDAWKLSLMTIKG